MNTEIKRIPRKSASFGEAMLSRLSALESIYDKIAEAQERFRQSARAKGHRIACSDGCGHCCEGFMPDLLRVEADAIAAHLLISEPDLLRRLEAPGSSCPFIDPDKPGENCGIYQARPLVCRLFGFSATLGKNGEPEFSLCKHMTPPPGLEGRKFLGPARLERLFGSLPPVMAHYSMEVSSIDPESAGERESLAVAVPRSLSKIGLGLTLAGSSE